MSLNDEIGQGDHDGLYGSGDTNQQELPTNTGIDLELPQPEPVGGFYGAKVPNDQKRGQPLEQAVAKAAPCTPSQETDEQGISYDDVCNASGELIQRGRLGISQGPQDAGAHVIADNGNQAQQIQTQVSGSVFSVHPPGLNPPEKLWRHDEASTVKTRDRTQVRPAAQ